jgi:hypothetical protein
MAFKRDDGLFSFDSATIRSLERMSYSADQDDSTNDQCLTAVFNSISKQLDLQTTDCNEKRFVVCRKVLFTKPDCNKYSTFKGKTTLEIMLNKTLNLYKQQMIAYKKAEIKDMMKRLDQNKAFESIFKALWYAPLPCFDVRNITTDQESLYVSTFILLNVPIMEENLLFSVYYQKFSAVTYQM